MSPGSPLLTTCDVSELLQLTDATIRSWIFGREYRIAVEDVEAFLETHATRPPRNAGSVGIDRQRETN